MVLELTNFMKETLMPSITKELLVIKTALKEKINTEYFKCFFSFGSAPAVLSY